MPYPILLNLAQRRCVVIGAGRVAERRVEGLLRQQAAIRLVAPQAAPALRRFADIGKLTWMRTLYSPAHLEGAFLVVAATDDPDINAVVTRDAHARNILVCRVDAPEEGSYVTPSVVERGDLLIALATGGKSPTLTAVLKDRIEQEFGPEWGAWTELCGRLRPTIQERMSEEARRTAVEAVLSDSAIAERVRAGDVAGAFEEAMRCISSPLV